MMTLRLIVAALLLTTVAWAETPKAIIRGPDHIPAGATLALDGTQSVSDRPLVWEVRRGPGMQLMPLDSGGRIGVVALAWNVQSGSYLVTLKARGIDDDGEPDADIDFIEILVGEPTPPPIPPGPTPGPGPTPTPTPVPPAPTPDPSPFPGFAVFYVWETAGQMPPAQLNAFYSTRINDWLNTHTSKTADGRPAWRKWDKDINVSNEAVDVKLLWMAILPKIGPLPQLVISKSGSLTFLPFPTNEAELLKTLQSFGGT
jgi:hypothetical protein